jgi:hypothetical protein
MVADYKAEMQKSPPTMKASVTVATEVVAVLRLRKNLEPLIIFVD